MILYKNNNCDSVSLNGISIKKPIDWQKKIVKNEIYLKARIGWQGLKNSEFIKEGFFFCVTGKDFKENKIDWKKCYKVQEDRFMQDKKIQLSSGDVLITKDGTIGKIALVENIPDKHYATLNSGVFVSRSKTINNLFWFYLLKSFVFKDFIDKQKSGSTILHLNQKSFESFEFIAPSIEEQKRIADVLSKQESIINKTKDLIEQLDKRNTFMQDELLSGRLRIKEEDGQVEFYKNPDDNWQTVLMNNIDYIIPLDWDILSLEHSDCSMGETILKSNILTDGEYPVYSATESDKIFGYINNPKKILEIGDLIISARGTIGYVKIAKQKCTSTQTTIQLKVNEITPIYLSTVLNNKRADFFPISGGAVPQITISQVKSIKISKPKQEKEIFNITNIIEKLNDEKEKYEELLIEEQKKFDFLLEELMSGRLRIEE